MKRDLVHTLTDTFEGHAQQTEDGVEYWLARDLQHLLGYAEWRNFIGVISRARTACEISGQPVRDHFVEVNKMVDLGSGSQREVEDLMLTRYACYLIAQNGDPKKNQIAFAQTYFALQTRKAEVIEQRLLEAERVSARRKLSETEKELSSLIYEQTGGNQDFALIRSKGDTALFGRNTQAMKARWKVPGGRALADFAPTIVLKAKDFATEITIHNARAHLMQSEAAISAEH
ncbi:MAG: DNA damage-inducible protein D, partial [Gemmatimonadales bacterium]|nr:DNA damage-inducible protein D [Gemmatimonadales bacterium]